MSNAKHRAPRPSSELAGRIRTALTAAVLAGIVLAALLAVATAAGVGAQVTPTTLGAGYGAPAHSAPAADHAAPLEAGDDNGDGVIDEDESGWDCSTMGNGMCAGDTEAEAFGAGNGAVCGTDAQCVAYDRHRGTVSDGRP